jgi:hypothetical protein
VAARHQATHALLPCEHHDHLLQRRTRHGFRLPPDAGGCKVCASACGDVRSCLPRKRADRARRDGAGARGAAFSRGGNAMSAPLPPHTGRRRSAAAQRRKLSKRRMQKRTYQTYAARMTKRSAVLPRGVVPAPASCWAESLDAGLRLPTCRMAARTLGSGAAACVRERQGAQLFVCLSWFLLGLRSVEDDHPEVLVTCQLQSVPPIKSLR